MSANAPWSVKGIDAKAREVAKDLARRSGLTLGEWLNQMILKGEDVGALISRERAREEEASAPRMAEARQYEERQAEPRHYESRQPESRQAESRQFAESRRAAPAPAYDDEEPYDLVRPAPRAYREEPQRRAAPFSTGAVASRDLRRRSIFDEKPRVDAPSRDVPFRDPLARDERPRYDDGYEPEGNELTRVARALENLGSRIEQSETRSAGAVRGVSHAVESLLTRLERSEAAQAETRGRLEEHTEAFERLSRHSEAQTPLGERLEQAERLIDAQAERLEGLSGHVREERERLERVERQAASPIALETVRAVEGALGKLANQLYEGDARTRDSIKDVREDMVGMSHRLAQMETRDPERAAQALIDKVVTQLAHRLEAAEAQTTGALRTLEQAFTALDGRLNRMEERGDVTDPAQVASLKSLAAELQRKLEDSRAEMLNTLQHQTDVSLERTLSTIDSRIAQSEKHQALAIERMGLDVVRVADNLNRRVNEVEDANSDGLTRMGQEIGRINGGIEARFDRAESSHAQALERLGNEIARISERLSVKVAESERRTAAVLGGVGEQIEHTQRNGRAELETRIRQSEERTQKLLEETRARIDSRLAMVQTHLLAEVAPRAARPQADTGGLSNPFRAQTAAPVYAEPEPETEDDIESVDFSRLGGGFDSDEPVEAADEEAFDLTGRLLKPAFADGNFKPEFDPFEDDDLEGELEPTPLFHAHIEDEGDPFAEVDPARKTPSRVAAARVEPRHRAESVHQRVQEEDDFGAVPSSRDMHFEEEEPGVSVSTRDALAAARAAVRASMTDDGDRKTKALGGLKAAPSKSRGNAPVRGREAAAGSTVGQALKASVVAVGGIAVVAGIGWLLKDGLESKPNKPVDNTIPVAAAVLTPEAANQGGLNAEYLEALKLLEANSPGAVDRMKMVAQQGYAPAQERLGELFDDPKGLVPADKSAAFEWTKKAAEGGLAGAMNRVAMMYYEGNGVARDPSLTAVWLRRAAKRGEVDSAFNLGALYMKGEGVPANPTEAYAWMMIAAKGGDKQAAQTAAALKAQLTEAQIAKVHDEVESFQPLTDSSGGSSVSASVSGSNG
jgi:localization factor PodJL